MNIRSLRWITLIFLLALSLVFGVRVLFDRLESDLRARDANERARLFIGEEILHGIQALERDIYRMATTHNAHAFRRIRLATDARMEKLAHDLNVLGEGGVSTRTLRLNLEGLDEAVREVEYRPNLDEARLVMEQIEILPHLEAIETRIDALEQLLVVRWQALERQEQAGFLRIEDEISMMLMRIPPLFERLDENANRLFFESGQRLDALERELQAQHARLKLIETLLIILLMGLGGGIGILYLRRINDALAKEKTARDEVARKQAENAIMLDTLSDGVYATDMDGTITFLNKSAADMLGWRGEELVGRNAHEVLQHSYPDGRHYPPGECPLMSVLRDGISLQGEEHFIHRDGRFVHIAFRSNPLHHAGQRVGALVSFQDVGARKEAEALIRLQQAAIREANQAILITYADPTEHGPTIRFVNPAFSQLTGYVDDEIIGRRTGTLRSPHCDSAKLRRLTEALYAGEHLVIEMDFVRKDGTPFIAEVRYAPVPDERGQTAHFVATLTDISQHKELEIALSAARDQALENVRIKSAFLANMSHEIRTPMNGIIGMTDLLLDTALTQEQRDFAIMVRESAQALLTVINDILDFSKIEAGKLALDDTDFSLIAVVEGAVELLATKSREKGLALMSFIDPALPTRMRGDPTRLRQVLLNLIGNAVKFTLQGGIEVLVQGEERADGPRVRFEVRDTGIGISPRAQERLFQSFVQADNSTTRKFGGTGLGLAISKQIVELMGGTIGVSSTEGSGSTFWFSLPLHQAASAEPPQTPPPHAPCNPCDLRVLAVDDSALDRDVLRRYFTSWGIQGDTADGAESALRLIAAARDRGAAYDVLLIDYEMPGMNGIALARHLTRSMKGKLPRLALLTAYDQRDLFDQARAAGFATCLVKPVRRSQLFDTLMDLAPTVEDLPLPASLPETSPSVDLGAALETGRLLLLVEDNRVNQKVATAQLRKLGYAVHVVDNGQEAVDAAASLPYAAILMDCQMPVMDGFEATETIRRAERETGRRIPIIAMTANAMQGDREHCLMVGMDDYISKPFRPDELLRILERWVPAPSETPASAAPAQAQPALSTGTPLATLDIQKLQEFLGDDREMICNLLETFRSDTLALLEKMRRAITDRNTTAIKALAHETKGASGNIGIHALADIAARLEKACVTEDWDEVAKWLAELERNFAHIEGTLRSPFGERSDRQPPG